MTPGDLIEKQLHAARIDLRQDQTVQLACTSIDCAVGIGIFMGQHGLAHGLHGVRRPTPALVRDTAKPRLVLKHQFDGLSARPVLDDFAEDFREFFIHSS